ncbi:hypothetical protein C8R45DRAFT_1223718 [Mycena sanguinolenta]|nr:hypothetical protein C8R45DRAFT_1223718 [Mycena sanguinolenta]
MSADTSLARPDAVYSGEYGHGAEALPSPHSVELLHLYRRPCVVILRFALPAAAAAQIEVATDSALVLLQAVRREHVRKIKGKPRFAWCVEAMKEAMKETIRGEVGPKTTSGGRREAGAPRRKLDGAGAHTHAPRPHVASRDTGATARTKGRQRRTRTSPYPQPAPSVTLLRNTAFEDPDSHVRRASSASGGRRGIEDPPR